MGIFFSNFRHNSCCLCGSKQNLTGEHKIKASQLRKVFGTEKMVIGSLSEPSNTYRYAQGVKSDNLKFKTRMCSACNDTLTQPADYEFDKLHTFILSLIEEDKEPHHAFSFEHYTVGSNAYLNVFRYFAKLLCCHLAEADAPRPKLLSRFAIGRSNMNRIYLTIDKDFDYQRLQNEFGDFQYAAHGGLAFYEDKQYYCPKRFHSTLTIGLVRYIFYWNIHPLEKFELRFFHRKFCKKMQFLAKKAIQQPLTSIDLMRLGLHSQKIVDD
jgi:hypothetical protein